MCKFLMALLLCSLIGCGSDDTNKIVHFFRDHHEETKAPRIQIQIKSKNDYKMIVNYANIDTFVMNMTEYKEFYDVLEKIKDKAEEWEKIVKSERIENFEKEIPLKKYIIVGAKNIKYALRAFVEVGERYSQAQCAIRIELWDTSNKDPNVHIMMRFKLYGDNRFRSLDNRSPDAIEWQMNFLINGYEETKKKQEFLK